MKFYVYEHWRPDLDVCFYVGKGQGRRANDMCRSRNRHHKGIQKKLSNLGMCVEVRMVAEGLMESEALRIECERIAFWLSNKIKLANQTTGGDGLRNPTIVTRAKMAEAARNRTGRKDSPEVIARRKAAVAEARKRNPQIIERIRAAAQAQWSNPETRTKILKGLQSQSPSEKRSSALKARMARQGGKA